MKNLWYAEFTYAYSSSSGTERYEITKDGTAYVVTTGDGISEVEKVIANQLGQGHRVKINTATFIGEVWGV